MYKNGTILICKGKKAISKAINAATEGDSTHTAQIVWINGIMCVIDAQKEGVFPRSYVNWMKEYDYDYRAYEYPNAIDDKQYSAACVNMFGMDYDVKHLTIGFWRKFFGLGPVKAKYENNTKAICTEISMRLLAINGYKATRFADKTPDGVEKFVIEWGFKRIK